MAEADPRIYRRGEVVAFRKTNEPFGGLSNMAPGFPIRILDVRILTSEAIYQACRFPHLPEVQKLIIAQTSPMTAKMRSKPYRDDSRPDWDTVRIPIMKWCLRVKLAQNWHKFGDLLLETGNRPIVEDSRKDDFWGATPDEAGILRGRNVLGRLLMELREKLKSDPESLQTVQPVPIPDFLLFERAIPVLAREISLEARVPERVEDTPTSPSLFLPVEEEVAAVQRRPSPHFMEENTHPDVPAAGPDVRENGRTSQWFWLGVCAILLSLVLWLMVG